MNYSPLNHKTQEPLDADDAALRSLLAAHAQPRPVRPPSDMAQRVLRSLPTDTPVRAAARMRWRQQRQWIAGISGLVLVLLLALVGGWAVLVDSAAVVALFGGATSVLGYVVLSLVLIATALVNAVLVLNVGTPMLGVLPVLIAAAWAWWFLIQQPLPRRLVSAEANVRV
ncbi:MAG: hypothetical protein HC876_00875 [Chloroflexaceae bacterium]|nr:hypothetical protein [Chloroflexaceae bacterium]NJO04190.1 hypothetical protein [Chloroflexaceae bacterium]